MIDQKKFFLLGALTCRSCIVTLELPKINWENGKKPGKEVLPLFHLKNGQVVDTTTGGGLLLPDQFESKVG